MAGPYNQGWQGYVGFGTQGSFGTAVPPTVFQDVGEGSAELKLQKPNKTLITGIRGTNKPIKVSRALGKVTVDGSISGAMYPDDFLSANIFACLNGNNNTVTPIGGDGAANGYLHEFLPPGPGENADYPVGITIEEKVGGFGDIKVKRFVSCFCNGFSLEIPESGIVNISTDWIGQNEAAPGSLTSSALTFSPEAPFEHLHAKLEIGPNSGALVDVAFESLTFTHTVNAEMVNNNFNCTKFATGVRFGVPDISMELVLKSTEDNTQYLNYFDDVPQWVRLTLKHDAFAGSAPGSEYEIVIDMPSVEYFGETEGITGTEQLTQPLQFQALHDFVEAFTVRYKSKNSVASTYSA